MCMGCVLYSTVLGSRKPQYAKPIITAITQCNLCEETDEQRAQYAVAIQKPNAFGAKREDQIAVINFQRVYLSHFCWPA